MRDLQSSIAEVTSTVVAAMQKQSDNALLPHLVDTLHAIETKATISTNGVKKHLVSFDQTISGLSSNISALKEEMATRGANPNKATTTAESISTLREDLSAHGAKLDKAIAIIEAQQQMMTTLLELMQKGSVEIKEDIVRLHTHFDGVAERIAFVDGNSSQNATSMTPGPLITGSGCPPPISALPDHAMDVDVSAAQSHSVPDSVPDDHSNVVCNQANTLTHEMIIDAPSADGNGVTIVEESQSAGINSITAAAQLQFPSADTADRPQTDTGKGPSRDVASDNAAVVENALPSTHDTHDAGGGTVAAETEESNIQKSVDQDIVIGAVGE